MDNTANIQKQEAYQNEPYRSVVGDTDEWESSLSSVCDPSDLYMFESPPPVLLVHPIIIDIS